MRLLLLLLFGWLAVSLIRSATDPVITFRPRTGEWAGVLLSGLACMLLLLRINRAPFRIAMDLQRSRIKSWSLFGLPRTTELTDVRGFSDTSATSKIGEVRGCLIYGVNGRTFEVNNRCVRNIPALRVFLLENRVQCLGLEGSTSVIGKWFYRFKS